MHVNVYDHNVNFDKGIILTIYIYTHENMSNLYVYDLECTYNLKTSVI